MKSLLPARPGRRVKGWKVWRKNKSKHQRREELHGEKAATVAVTAVQAAGTVVRGAKAARGEAVPAEVLEVGPGASASISARRRCASSASRRWTSSTTSARTSFRNSCRSAGRFCHGE